jgi:hypothetical protein
MAKLRRGIYKKEMDIEREDKLPVSISCREGSTITIDAYEVEGDIFDVYLMHEDHVKTAPLLPVVISWDRERAIWSKEDVDKVKKAYTAKERATYWVIFENVDSEEDWLRLSIDLRVQHPPLKVGDEPLRESFEVDARDFEKIDVDAKAGDTIRIFGRVTSGNDITTHIISKIYETPDSVHFDKAYWTTEKTEEIDAEYRCTKTEPLLIIFDNTYSRLTTKTVDVSVQIIKGEEPTEGDWVKCPFCQHKNPKDSTVCEKCKAEL